MTDEDHELLEVLAELNATTATFSTDLFAGKLDQEAHIEMALMAIDMADRVLKRLIAG